MSNCRYCHEKAGFLKDVHESCIAKYKGGLNTLAGLVDHALRGSESYGDIEERIRIAISEGRVPQEEANQTMIQSAEKACLDIAVHTPIDAESFERIYAILEGIGYTKTVRPGFIATMMSRTLDQVLHDEPVYFDGQVAFQIGNEVPIMSIEHAVLAEYKTVSQRGLYQSVSLPIGMGMYYRVGASTPPTKQFGLVPTDEGGLLFTDTALYFGGNRSTLRIPYKNILRLESFTDGVGVFQSHGSGKVFIPGYGRMEAGWFFYNLLSALSSKALKAK